MRLVDSPRVGQCVKFEVMRDAGLAVVGFEWKVGLPFNTFQPKYPTTIRIPTSKPCSKYI